MATVVLEVRLPRILAAILVGGALSVSGASYQTMFKNPWYPLICWVCPRGPGSARRW